MLFRSDGSLAAIRRHAPQLPLIALDDDSEAAAMNAGFAAARGAIRRDSPDSAAIARLRATLPNLPLSVDTQKPEVASAALDAGAHLINDIWGVRPGDEMLRLAAERGVPLITIETLYDAKAHFSR